MVIIITALNQIILENSIFYMKCSNQSWYTQTIRTSHVKGIHMLQRACLQGMSAYQITTIATNGEIANRSLKHSANYHRYSSMGYTN